MSEELVKLVSRHEALSRAESKLAADHRALLSFSDQLASALQVLKDKAQDLELVQRLFEQLLQRLIQLNVDRVNELLTRELAFVFSDEYRFLAELTLKRKMASVDFVIEQSGRRLPVLDSYGGSLATLCSILLRVLVILRLNLRRVLILDEPMAAFSDVKVPLVGQLLAQLCDKLSFDILVVTHKQGLQDFAHRVFYCSKEGGKLKVRMKDARQPAD